MACTRITPALTGAVVDRLMALQAAARTAHRARTESLRLVRHNPWVHTMLATNISTVMAELHAVLQNSDAPRT